MTQLKNRPRLSSRERKQLPNGILLDSPTVCELGCGREAYIKVGDVCICKVHYGRALDIRSRAERSGNRSGTSGRHPECYPIALRRAVA
jgi:hypothetical protein